GGGTKITDLGLQKINNVPRLQPTDPGFVKVDNYPEVTPVVLDATQGSPAACLGWSLDISKKTAHTSVYVSKGLPAETTNADGSSKVQSISNTGPNGLPITGFYMPPGFGAVVQSATESSATFFKGPIQLISDRGLRYGVPDQATAGALGLTDAL